MRKDMKWILGDKRGSRLAGPRKGRRFSQAEFRKYDWDVDDTPFVGGHVGHALEKKLIGERRQSRGLNYEPLQRYLSSQVGRPWNDVYSNVSSALRRTKIAEAHWSYLLTQCVATRLHIVGSELLWGEWDGALVPMSNERAPKLYVDPRDGRLHRNTAIETRRMRQKRLAAESAREMSARMRVLSPIRQLHLLGDGNWWEVKLADVRRARELGLTEDVVLRAGLSNLPREKLYGRRWAFACDKRQLSAKEMKQYGLR